MKSPLRVAWMVLLCGAVCVSLAGCSGEPLKLQWAFSSNAPIYSTPSVSSNLILFGNENGMVTAIDKNGNYKWNYTASMNVISSPAVYNDRVFFGSVNYSMYSVDLQGREVWRYPTRKPIKSDPLIKDGILYFSSYDGHIYAVRPEDKSTVWTYPSRQVQKPAGEEPGAEPAEPQIVPAEFSYSSPVISGNVLYVGNLDGNLYAVDVTSGKLRWRFKTGDGVTSTPAVENGIVYFGSNDNNVYAVDESGKKVWAFKTGAWVNASPRVKDGVVYIGSHDKNFYLLDAKTGAVKNKFTTTGQIIAIPALYKNYIILCAGQGDGSIYVLENPSLKVLFKYTTGAKIEADPVISGDTLYVASHDKQLYSFKINLK